MISTWEKVGVAAVVLSTLLSGVAIGLSIYSTVESSEAAHRDAEAEAAASRTSVASKVYLRKVTDDRGPFEVAIFEVDNLSRVPITDLSVTWNVAVKLTRDNVRVKSFTAHYAGRLDVLPGCKTMRFSSGVVSSKLANGIQIDPKGVPVVHFTDQNDQYWARSQGTPPRMTEFFDPQYVDDPLRERLERGQLVTSAC